jgi:cytidylate kinase
MAAPMDIPGIRNITVSGRIGAGATTLAVKLANKLGWKLLEGGALFEKIHKELNLDQSLVHKRPDKFDLEYEEKIKKMLKEESHHIIQSHLAGYDAQGIDGVFKILIVCEDSRGEDKREVRIDRLMNRDQKSAEEAKHEVLEREGEHLSKFRRLYADSDPNWVYWDKKYYDLVINTYDKNANQTFQTALQALGIR